MKRSRRNLKFPETLESLNKQSKWLDRFYRVGNSLVYSLCIKNPVRIISSCLVAYCTALPPIWLKILGSMFCGVGAEVMAICSALFCMFKIANYYFGRRALLLERNVDFLDLFEVVLEQKEQKENQQHSFEGWLQLEEHRPWSEAKGKRLRAIFYTLLCEQKDIDEVRNACNCENMNSRYALLEDFLSRKVDQKMKEDSIRVLNPTDWDILANDWIHWISQWKELRLKLSGIIFICSFYMVSGLKYLAMFIVGLLAAGAVTAVGISFVAVCTSLVVVAVSINLYMKFSLFRTNFIGKNIDSKAFQAKVGWKELTLWQRIREGGKAFFLQITVSDYINIVAPIVAGVVFVALFTTGVAAPTLVITFSAIAIVRGLIYFYSYMKGGQEKKEACVGGDKLVNNVTQKESVKVGLEPSLGLPRASLPSVERQAMESVICRSEAGDIASRTRVDMPVIAKSYADMLGGDLRPQPAVKAIMPKAIMLSVELKASNTEQKPILVPTRSYNLGLEFGSLFGCSLNKRVSYAKQSDALWEDSLKSEGNSGYDRVSHFCVESCCG